MRTVSEDGGCTGVTGQHEAADETEGNSNSRSLWQVNDNEREKFREQNYLLISKVIVFIYAGIAAKPQKLHDDQ